MPENFNAPSHTSIADTVREGVWHERLAPYQREHPVAEPSFYYDLISPLSSSIDMWEPTYMHVLEGDDPIVEWTKGTMLRPLLDHLSEEEAFSFLSSYAKKWQKPIHIKPMAKPCFRSSDSSSWLLNNQQHCRILGESEMFFYGKGFR